MEIYQYWLVAAIVLVIVEICTAGFGSICFAVGAGFSALVAGLGGSFVWQIIVFAAVSLLTLSSCALWPSVGSTVNRRT